MDGFGSADFETPFHYGSVKDGFSHNPSIEQRFKKQYWKTKQSVRQKLNKKEDQFVVAGDALVDAKLEVHIIYSIMIYIIYVNRVLIMENDGHIITDNYAFIVANSVNADNIKR